ncbi:MAG TPA: putative motility protein [Phycisphaerae bacterium]|nr:putative motility protein [Phycisphaerae bacterium]
MVTSAQSNLIDSALAPGQMNGAVSVSVLKKALDASRQEGASAVQLIDDAGAVQAGDPLVAKATGLGGLIDVQA